METDSCASATTDLASYFALAGGFALHPVAERYTADFGDAAFRTAAGISNEHLIPRSLTLSFCMPGEQDRHRVEPDAYLKSLLVALRRITELFDEDREVMHVVLADGLPEYLGVQRLGHLLDAVPRYLRTTAFPDISVTVRAGSEINPLLLAAAGCTRGTLIENADPARADASPDAGKAMVTAGFQGTAYRVCLASDADHRWAARMERALEWRPDRVLLQWPGQGCDADAAARILQAAALLERRGYAACGADTYARRGHASFGATRMGAAYCDLQGMLRPERTDMIGIGPGATSQVGDVYCRTSTDYLRWSAGLESGHLCIERGLLLSESERMCAELLQSLACNHALDCTAMEARHELFPQCLEDALPRLGHVLDGNLAYWEQKILRLTPLGKLLWRAAADCFRSPALSCPIPA